MEKAFQPVCGSRGCVSTLTKVKEKYGITEREEKRGPKAVGGGGGAWKIFPLIKCNGIGPLREKILEINHEGAQVQAQRCRRKPKIISCLEGLKQQEGGGDKRKGAFGSYKSQGKAT